MGGVWATTGSDDLSNTVVRCTGGHHVTFDHNCTLGNLRQLTTAH